MQTYQSHDGKEFKFNDHICVEMLLGVPDEKRTGRLVQVRKGVGDFGTDLYFVRLRDGSLMTFHNVMIRHAGDRRFEMAFYESNGKAPPKIPFQPINPSDSTDAAYSMAGGKYPETGFVIEAPKQPESSRQSFGIMIVTEK